MNVPIKFARNGRTEACPEWEPRGLPTEWAHKQPVPNGRAEACPAGRPKAYPNWAHGDLPRMGASRPAHNERTEAAQTGRTEACPECAHSDLPRKGAPKHAQGGRREACPEWARRGLPGMDAQRTARNGRTEACPERAPGQEHGGERDRGRLRMQCHVSSRIPFQMGCCLSSHGERDQRGARAGLQCSDASWRIAVNCRQAMRSSRCPS